MSTPMPAPTEEEIRDIVAGQLHLEGPLLPILHDCSAISAMCRGWRLA